MEYGRVPGVDKPCARLVLGSLVFRLDRMDLVRELLDAYVALGGNVVDTAYSYNGGQSEQAIGQWLQERGNRHQMVILTKGAHPDATGPRVTPEHIEHDLMCSLERLQTDYIDLYMLHRDNPELPVGPIMECLNEHKRAGRIRALGASNWTPERIAEANAYAAAHGLDGFVASSPHISLAKAKEPLWPGCVSVTRESQAWYVANQFPAFAWSSQARGFFTGRYAPGQFGERDVARVYDRPDNWERLRRAQELAARRGATANQVALAWVLAQPYPTFALIGPASRQELEDSVGALRLRLTPEEVAWLDLAG